MIKHHLTTAKHIAIGAAIGTILIVTLNSLNCVIFVQIVPTAIHKLTMEQMK